MKNINIEYLLGVCIFLSLLICSIGEERTFGDCLVKPVVWIASQWTYNVSENINEQVENHMNRDNTE